MKRMLPAILLPLLLAAAAEAAPPKPVQLPAEAVRRLGITVASAQPAIASTSTQGFARVLDPVPLAQLQADLTAAETAAAASAAEARRTQALYADDATMSRKAAEAARAQASADASKLALLRQRLALEWGPALSRLSSAQRTKLIAGLASGSAALVRIDAPNGAGLQGLRSAELDLGPAGTATALVLGPARVGDVGLRSPGVIARVSGPNVSYLSSGLTVPARIRSEGGGAGFLVPAAAVLRVESASWVYVQERSGFIRRRLGGLVAGASGLVATSGLRAGDHVVVRGASKLYAAEQGGGPEED